MVAPEECPRPEQVVAPRHSSWQLVDLPEAGVYEASEHEALPCWNVSWPALGLRHSRCTFAPDYSDINQPSLLKCQQRLWTSCAKQTTTPAPGRSRYQGGAGSFSPRSRGPASRPRSLPLSSA